MGGVKRTNWCVGNRGPGRSRIYKFLPAYSGPRYQAHAYLLADPTSAKQLPGCSGTTQNHLE